MVNPSAKPYIDARRLTLDPRDLLLVRSDIPWTKKDMADFDTKLRKLYPEWKGVVLMTGTDQTIEKLPVEKAYHLYLRLKAVFEDDFQKKLQLLTQLRGENDQIKHLLDVLLKERNDGARDGEERS